MSSIAREGILNEEPAIARLPSKSSSSHHQKHRENDRARTASPDDDVKYEDGGPDVRMADAKPTYKSWKKKYRKSRIKFDALQAANEELYQLEQKTLLQTKRIAVQNDRLLDILLSNNDVPQIPQERRFDLSLPIPSGAEEDGILPIDRKPQTGPPPAKFLRDLIQDVPHYDFAEALERYPADTNELLTGIDSPVADASLRDQPPTFLTADDIDNYLWEVDNQISRDPEVFGHMELLPTLAPLAREQRDGKVATPLLIPPKGATAAGASSASTASRDRDLALRNPTSVYNWLRKHAPKTFLQDHEGGDEKKDKGSERSHHRKGARGEEDDDDDEKKPAARKSGGGSSRKPAGSISVGRSKAAKADRPPVSKRVLAPAPKDKRKSLDAPMLDAQDEFGAEEPAPSSKGKRKRPAADDDTGYRPKGGSSRKPAKKRSKNNSIGGASTAEALTDAGEGEERTESEVAVAKKETGKVLDEVEAVAGRQEAHD